MTRFLLLSMKKLEEYVAMFQGHAGLIVKQSQDRICSPIIVMNWSDEPWITINSLSSYGPDNLR